MKKKQQSQTLNLFETITPPTTAETLAKLEEIPAPQPKAKPAKIVCSRCGGKCLISLRPEQHAGKTHYCVVGCTEENDSYEPFYFTPKEPVE